MEGELFNNIESKEIPKTRLVHIETPGYEGDVSSFEFLEVPENLDLQKEYKAYGDHSRSSKSQGISGFLSFSEWLMKTQDGVRVAKVETIQVSS